MNVKNIHTSWQDAYVSYLLNYSLKDKIYICFNLYSKPITPYVIISMNMNDENPFYILFNMRGDNEMFNYSRIDLNEEEGYKTKLKKWFMIAEALGNIYGERVICIEYQGDIPEKFN